MCCAFVGSSHSCLTVLLSFSSSVHFGHLLVGGSYSDFLCIGYQDAEVNKRLLTAFVLDDEFFFLNIVTPGECESNRVFMLTNCPAACRFCLLLHSGMVS